MIENEADVHPYLELKNAIITQAVFDYEAVISDAPLPTTSGTDISSMTKASIREFAKGTHITDWLDKIDRIYNEEFRPYVKDHAEEIVRDWKKIQRLPSDWDREQAMKASPHKCPLCGGTLKPQRICQASVITCNYCYLNMRIPKKEKKK